jgi:hypothetical protein
MRDGGEAREASVKREIPMDDEADLNAFVAGADHIEMVLAAEAATFKRDPTTYMYSVANVSGAVDEHTARHDGAVALHRLRLLRKAPVGTSTASTDAKTIPTPASSSPSDRVSIEADGRPVELALQQPPRASLSSRGIASTVASTWRPVSRLDAEPPSHLTSFADVWVGETKPSPEVLARALGAQPNDSTAPAFSVGHDTLPETIAKMRQVAGALAGRGFTRLAKHVAEAATGVERGGMGDTGPSISVAITEAIQATARAASAWRELAPNVKIPAGYEGTFNEFIAPTTETFAEAAKALDHAKGLSGMLFEKCVAAQQENVDLRLKVKDLQAKLGVAVPAPPEHTWEFRYSDKKDRLLKHVHVCSRCSRVRFTYPSPYAEIPETIEYPTNVGYYVEDPGCLAEVSDG